MKRNKIIQKRKTHTAKIAVRIASNFLRSCVYDVLHPVLRALVYLSISGAKAARVVVVAALCFGALPFALAGVLCVVAVLALVMPVYLLLK